MGVHFLSLDHFSYFLLFLDTFPLYPKTFLTDETYRYSLKEIKPSISTQDFSSFETELPEFPGILLIDLNEKIMTADHKCRSLSSETKKKSRKPGVDDSDGLSAKKEEIKEATSFSNDFSCTPTRFTSAFVKDGHVTDEDMKPVQRERSSSAIFSRSRRCELVESKVKVTREAERQELEEDSGSPAKVLESDCKDHKTTPQKKNLRELKLLLYNITGNKGNSPSRSSNSDEGDKIQPYDSCSKANRNALFNKQSPNFKLISKELPEISNRSFNKSNLSSKNTKNGNSSFKDSGLQAIGVEIFVKPQSQREDKVFSRISDSYDQLKNCRRPKDKSANLLKQPTKASANADQTSSSFSQRISGVSGKPSEIITSKNCMKLTNPVGKIKSRFHLTTQESSRSHEAASVCSGLPNLIKSDLYSESERIEQKDDLKPQRMAGDNKQRKGMTQQFGKY